MVDARSLCYIRGMAGNSEHDGKAEQRLTKDQRLAHEVLEWGERFAPRAAHSAAATFAVGAAVTLAKSAVNSFKLSLPEDGLRRLSRAQSAQQFAAMAALSRAAERGQSIIEGQKMPRRDKLRLLMEKAIAKLPEKHTWRDVLAKTAEIDIAQKVIQSINYKEENIEWFDGKKVQDTDFHQFRKRLTRIREKSK